MFGQKINQSNIKFYSHKIIGINWPNKWHNACINIQCGHNEKRVTVCGLSVKRELTGVKREKGLSAGEEVCGLEKGLGLVNRQRTGVTRFCVIMRRCLWFGGEKRTWTGENQRGLLVCCMHEGRGVVHAHAAG
jgi:hypothetical protein